jgi:hypothetical protein
MFGWIANSHFVCVDCGDDPEWGELTARTHQATLSVIANQEVPLPFVYRAFLRKHRRPLRVSTDLYISLDYIREQDTPQKGSRDEFEWTHAPTLTNAGLEVLVRQRAHEVAIAIYYSGSQFHESTVQRLIADMRRALNNITSNSLKRVSCEQMSQGEKVLLER